jgi:hypothetical protein
MMVESVKTSHCLRKAQKWYGYAIATLNFEEYHYESNTFLCHLVALDETWVQLGNKVE